MFTLANAREIQLQKWGGLYTEAPPPSLPPGASCQTWDTDFLIGQVGTRSGLINPITQFSPPIATLPIQYLKSTQVLGPANLTLAQDGNKVLYKENLTAPGTFTTFYNNVVNNARAVSETVNQREYIALSNLIAGSDQPRQYDGTNLDRISQVAPGAGPTVAVSSPTYPIVSITEIYAAQTVDTVVWGSYLDTNNAPPESANLYFMGVGGSTTFTANLNLNDVVYVSGVPTMDGQNPNGTYAVTSIGYYTDGNGVHQYFGVTADVANSDFIRGSSGGTYQITQALVQLSSPIPSQSAVINGKISIQGANVPQWNTTWTITETPTEGQLSIDSTALVSNVATYGYVLQSGEAPGWQPDYLYPISAQIVDPNGNVWQVTTPGTSGGTIPAFASSPQTDGGVTWTEKSGVQVLATVFNTTNGNGIFNIQNQPITSATPTSFTVAIASPNVSPAEEDANAVTGSGIVLIIDPGITTIGTGNPGVAPIFGNATGGDVLVLNPLVAAGERYAVQMFLTRNGYISPASPPVSFYTTGATGQITFSNLVIGPPDVIARIVAITLANAGIGGPYFWIPDSVIVLGSAASLGQSQTFQQTVLNDNVSVSLGPISISDAVLSAEENITVEGNNLQQQRELGESVKVVQWAGRTFFLGERAKIDSFQNLTFDGGTISNQPAGWTVSSALTLRTSIVTSPIVNTSLYISKGVAPQIVQQCGSRSGSGDSAIRGFLPGAPIVGNSLVFILTGYDGGAYTPPSGLTQQAVFNGDSQRIQIWTRTVQSGDGVEWSFTLTPTVYGQNLSIYEIPSGATFSGGAGQVITTNNLTSGSVVLSGTAMVFCAFEWDNGVNPALTSIAPSNYSVVQSFNGFSPFGNAASVLLASGTGLPSETISATPSPAWSTGAVWGTLICSYSAYAGGTINPTGTTLANVATLNQAAYQNAFLAPIIDSNTAYSIRVTAEVPSSSTNGSLVIELYSPSLATNWSFTVPFSKMSTTIKEFIGALNNPLWYTVPSDLELRVYPFNMAAGADLLIDRIEMFPTQQPVYTTQVAVSYVENPEAIDGVTGAIDTSILSSQAQTNHFVFLNKYYITTKSISGKGQTFSPIQSGTGEPDSWVVDEISNTVGSVGPLADDVGEEYVVVADYNGAYIFDGGNHMKISQEIQQIWDSIYEPSISTIWVLNDKRQQRLLFGVPLPTPNQWLPNAPTNLTPSTPNVMLACSYLGLMTGAEIANGHAVFPSAFTGALLFHDMKRKWTIWQIPAATAAWIDRPNAFEQIWFGQSGNGVSALSPTATTDNGNAIVSRYCTYGFADTADRERLQLGLARCICPYALAQIQGSGQFYLTVWPETFGTPANPNPYPFVQAPFTLSPSALDDVNVPLIVTANRAFFQIDSDGVAGTTWAITRLDVAANQDPRMMVTGR